MESCPLSVVRCPLSEATTSRGVHRPLPRGMSLLEVLAAIGVLSIGLLGLAALLPIGRYTIAEATKADHAGNCGRTALRAVAIRHMLDSAPQGNAAFAIDPLGGATKLGGIVSRITPNPAQADLIFKATDDLIVQLPENMNPPQAIGKPTAAPDYKGDYTWFLTVVPTPNSPTLFTVSVVVCFKRDLPPAEATASIAATGFYDLGYGGGSVTLSNLSAPFEVKENDWIALCGTNSAKPIPTLCRWYRVVAVGDDGVSLTLTGPDWDTSYTTTAVALGQSVVGVYTTTVEVSTDPTWKN